MHTSCISMISIWKYWIIVIFLTFSVNNAYGEEIYKVYITKIKDGDSLVGKHVSNNNTIEIRLWGIDAPEYGQSFSNKAKINLKRKVYRKKVRIKGLGYDKYDRLLAIVYEPGAKSSVNKSVIEDGYAWVYKKYCKKTICTDWLNVEAKARKKRKGLWREEKPLEPWTFKKLKYLNK